MPITRVSSWSRGAGVVDAGVIDEVWVFSDHYCRAVQASMAGPGAFFINRGVYPEVPSRRPFAAVRLQLRTRRRRDDAQHLPPHRSDGEPRLRPMESQSPARTGISSAPNDTESNGGAAGDQRTSLANALQGPDYGNERVVESWADDFLNYPNLTFYEEAGLARETWLRQGEIANQTNHHVNYMSWYFAHVPRAAGVNADGKQNNRWKYMMDISGTTPCTRKDGQPQPKKLSASGRAAGHVRSPR